MLKKVIYKIGPKTYDRLEFNLNHFKMLEEKRKLITIEGQKYLKILENSFYEKKII